MLFLRLHIHILSNNALAVRIISFIISRNKSNVKYFQPKERTERQAAVLRPYTAWILLFLEV